MSNARPPKLFKSFFLWYSRPELQESILGDLDEKFDEDVRNYGAFKARIAFAWTVLRFMRVNVIKPFTKTQKLNNYDMFRNYLKISLRVFRKERSFSLINLSGLILGFVCCLLIYLFINDELSFDKFHKEADRIYRISAAYMREGKWEPYASNSWRTAELIKTNFNEVEELVRIRSIEGFVMHGEQRIREERIAYVDKNFFEVFSFPLISGDRQSVLDGTSKTVISESIALKYFGDTDVVGRTLQVSDTLYQLQVSGVMKDMPPNSHFHLDILISPQTQRLSAPPSMYRSVGWDSQRVYARMKEDANISTIEERFPQFIDDNLDYLTSGNFKLFFQPLLDIHLKSDLGLELEPNGKMSNIYIFSFVAAFILFIACINYINLSTARSLRRAKEVGMRKVLGAKRSNLINQFLLESFVMTFLALLIAFGLSLLILPEFNEFANKSIRWSTFFEKELLLGLAIAFLFIGLIAGSYPSFVLSSFKAGQSIKGWKYSDKSSLSMRKALVVVQFTISIALIAATVIVFKQLRFLQQKELGINEKQVIAIPLQTMERAQLESFKTEASNHPAVLGLGSSHMRIPGWINNSTHYIAQDVEVDEEARKSMKIVRVDHDFFDLVEAKMLMGRSFSREFPSDQNASIIINEAAAAQLGWEEPIGKWIGLNESRLNTIGVVKDFHFESLHRKIPPTIFVLTDRFLFWTYARIDGAQMVPALEHLEKVYGDFVTNRDFEYSFVTDDVLLQYKAEEKFTQVFEIFTVLAILIASLGTFGLISFAVEQKSKEIGIRKVLGASVRNLTTLLTREFAIFLGVASFIAFPLTYYLMNEWMKDFIYRTNIGWTPFAIAAVSSILIAFSTTIFKSLRVALANPVDALRDE